MNHEALTTFAKVCCREHLPGFRRRSLRPILFAASFLLGVSAHPEVINGVWSVVSARAASRSTEPGWQKIENLVNVNFKNDLRLFTVMAALNAAGFDYESPSKEMSSVRKRIRQQFKQLDPQLQARLNSFYVTHRSAPHESEEQAVYTSLALLLSEPPDFEMNLDSENLPADAGKVLGFEKLVQEFYRTANIQSLWQDYQADYKKELASYRPILRQVIQESLRYFRIPARIVLDRQIIFMADLLNAKDVVNARNLERVYYVIVGPSDNPASNRIQLQHEYLHFIVDPLVEKFSRTLLSHRELLTLAQSQPRIKSDRRSRLLVIVAESLIESILLRLYPPENLESELVRLFREGLIFLPHFHRSLRLYEKSDMLSFPAYSDTLFAQIVDSKIRDDAKAIAAMEEKLQAARLDQLARRQEEQQERERRSRINSWLNEAGRLLSEKQYETAKEKLGQLLQEDPNNGSALFYLAQIASQQSEHARAFAYYSQVTRSSSSPIWARAWSLLRMGNFLASQSRFEDARSHFSQVLEMKGDLRGAREQAREFMARLPRLSE